MRLSGSRGVFFYQQNVFSADLLKIPPSIDAGFHGIPVNLRMNTRCWRHHTAEVLLMRGLQCRVGHAKIRALSE